MRCRVGSGGGARERNFHAYGGFIGGGGVEHGSRGSNANPHIAANIGIMGVDGPKPNIILL